MIIILGDLSVRLIGVWSIKHSSFPGRPYIKWETGIYKHSIKFIMNTLVAPDILNIVNWQLPPFIFDIIPCAFNEELSNATSWR